MTVLLEVKGLQKVYTTRFGGSSLSSAILPAVNSRYVPAMTSTTAAKNSMNAVIGFFTVTAI